MSYYLRVICKSSASPSAQLLINFIKEGIYFDVSPSIERFTDGDQSDQDSWNRLVILYDLNKRPVILINTCTGVLIDDEILEFRTALRHFISDRSIQLIDSHLDESRRIIAIELDPAGITDEAWKMIDCLQAFLARNYDGLIYAPDDGYYDSSLQPVIKLNQLRTV